MILALTALYLFVIAALVLFLAHYFKNEESRKKFSRSYLAWYFSKEPHEFLVQQLSDSARKFHLILYFLGIMVLVAAIFILALA